MSITVEAHGVMQTKHMQEFWKQNKQQHFEINMMDCF